MGRSGYNEDWDGGGTDWGLIIFRGQVNAAIKGKRGQAFLREMIEALDALPEKHLISDELQDATGAVCAIGSVGLKRGIPMDGLDPYDHSALAKTFGIAMRMVQEIEFENDESMYSVNTPEKRWQHVRDWAERNLKSSPA